jgi:hypothetical protein
MAKQKEMNYSVTDLVAVKPVETVTVLPPNSGVVGQFLEQTANMLRARQMRMAGLLRRLNESGQKTEALLRTAAEKMEAAETALEEQFQKEGLVSESDGNSDSTFCQF